MPTSVNPIGGDIISTQLLYCARARGGGGSGSGSGSSSDSDSDSGLTMEAQVYTT